MMSTGYGATTPVVVGVAQLNQRAADIANAAEPLELMVRVVEDAARDAGTTRLLERLELIAVIRGAWNYADPGWAVGQRVGARGARSAVTAEGGNAPQQALNLVCERIAAGQLDAAVVVGAEGIYSRRKARQLNVDRRVTRIVDRVPDETLGEELDMSSSFEKECGLTAPVRFYALFENALRVARAEGHREHRDRVAGLLERFNAVSAGNERSWLADRFTRAQIRDEAPDNRMVVYPYTKRMCSNWFTDQAAAVIVCSAELAQRLGIARDRWVFPQSGTDGHDTRLVSNRPSLCTSDAIRLAGRRAVELAGCGIDDVKHVDVYSCFPSAVQVAADELRLGVERELTVTGGMAYFGGPLGNYVTHSVASIVDRIRAEPDSLGLVTANGGYLTKHSFGVYGGRPPRDGYRRADLQPEIDACPVVANIDHYTGEVVLEAATVVYDAGRPDLLIAACRTPKGARTWATSSNAQWLDEATTAEVAGRAARIGAGHTLLA